jgi:hypothetical protein
MHCILPPYRSEKTMKITFGTKFKNIDAVIKDLTAVKQLENNHL